MTEQDKPWSVDQLAESAGLTSVYIRKLCQAGKIDGAYKVGRAWLVPAASARAWLDERRRQQTE